MEGLAINLILPLIEQLLPLFGTSAATSGTIGLVIKGLQTVIPLIGPFAGTVVPKIKNIIAAARGSGAVTAEQMTALDQLDAISDAAFNLALAAAELEDAKG